MSFLSSISEVHALLWGQKLGPGSGVKATQEVQVQGPDLDAEQELLVGHLQAPRMALQLPGLLQVLLHPPDVINRGFEDGALVPTHIPAGQAESEVRAQRTGLVFTTHLVGVSKPCLGF